MGSQQRENRPFSCGQFNRRAVHFRTLRDQVEAKLSDVDLRCAFTGAAAPECADTRFQFGHGDRLYKVIVCTDIEQSDPNTHHVTAALESLECLVVQDLFINETAKFAHVFLPGSSFLEKDGTFTNAERRISRVRKATPLPW